MTDSFELAEQFERTADAALAAAAKRRPEASARQPLLQDDEGWARVLEGEWHTLLLPEELGGLGLGFKELGSIFRAAGRHTLSGPLLEHAVIAPVLAAVAPDAQRSRLLEATAGSRTMAVTRLDGLSIDEDRMSISGVADAVRFGAEANEVLVLGRGDVVAALVPTERSGVEAIETESLDPGTRYARIEFTAVELQPEDIIRSPQGHPDRMRVRSAAMLAISAELAGIVEAAVTLSSAYAKERSQFGRPIGSFQAVAHMLADMATASIVLRSATDEALAGADRFPEKLDVIAAATKAFADLMAVRVLDGALQVHGGIAFTKEYMLYRPYARVLGLRDMIVPTDELVVSLGRGLLDSGSDAWPTW
jgi:alkylation response protein AidB-like acyl-CoA dehydrogenase